MVAQTYPEWEVIAWDDCSTDNSAEIVKSYSDPRIRYFLSSERIPLGRARSMALQEVRGEWVAFLDQDDIWVSDKLEKQLALGCSSPSVGFVYGRTVTFAPSGEQKDFDHRHEFEPLPEGPLLSRLFIDSCFVAMSSALFRRSALDELGGIPPNIQMSPDYFMYLGVSQRYEARAVQDVVCFYRIHGSNMTPQTFKQIHTECLWLIDRWSATMDPGLLARRRRVHQTLIALEELKRSRSVRQGLIRLLKNGSLPYLLSRPFARGFRALRRKIRRPCWRDSQKQAFRLSARLLEKSDFAGSK